VQVRLELPHPVAHLPLLEEAYGAAVTEARPLPKERQRERERLRERKTEIDKERERLLVVWRER
jgi:hypothetical protein